MQHRWSSRISIDGRALTPEQALQAEQMQIGTMTLLWNEMQALQKKIKFEKKPEEKSRLVNLQLKLQNQWTTAEKMLKEILQYKMRMNISVKPPQIVYQIMGSVTAASGDGHRRQQMPPVDTANDEEEIETLVAAMVNLVEEKESNELTGDEEPTGEDDDGKIEERGKDQESRLLVYLSAK